VWNIAVEEMRLRRYSHLLLANNDVIIPPLAVPLMLRQLRESFDLIVPISSRHGSGFGSEACCVCHSGIVSARSWAVAAAELPLCTAAIQRRLARASAEPTLPPPYASVWADSESGSVPPLPHTPGASHANINPSHPLPTLPAVPAVVSSPDSFLGYFLALNHSALRYAHAQGLFFDSSNVIFGQEGALREAIDRGGGSWGISTRAFVFHFKGATVHKRRLSLWSNEPPTRARGVGDKGDEASDYVRCRLRQVMARFV
jgi:hypothetical protein